VPAVCDVPTRASSICARDVQACCVVGELLTRLVPLMVALGIAVAPMHRAGQALSHACPGGCPLPLVPTGQSGCFDPPKVALQHVTQVLVREGLS
jgi:hypothetical protein